MSFSVMIGKHHVSLLHFAKRSSSGEHNSEPFQEVDACNCKAVACTASGMPLKSWLARPRLVQVGFNADCLQLQSGLRSYSLREHPGEKALALSRVVLLHGLW